MATFWRTFHHGGKSVQPLVRVGGARPPPFTLSTIMSKVVVYAPADKADKLLLFLLCVLPFHFFMIYAVITCSLYNLQCCTHYSVQFATLTVVLYI
jgi:hypothetical protein